MDSLRAAWQERTLRDRFALALGAAVVAVLLLYAFVWEPVRVDHKRLRESVPQLRAQAVQFATDAAEAQRLRDVGLRHPGGANTPASLEAAADRTGMRARIKSITEVSGGRVQVVLEPVPYEALVRWIGELTGSAGFAVESVQLRPGPAPGIVLVQTLVLKGAGAS